MAGIMRLFFLVAVVWRLSIQDQLSSSHGGVNDVGTILVSTLDGRLCALDARTGRKKWEMAEDPVLRAPSTFTQGFTLIPNPQDGSLYVLRDGELRKMPFNIPQLVRESPCRGNDGVLYVGSKKDEWIALDPNTGEKIEKLSHMESTKVNQCPASHDEIVFIGRTEYNIRMFEPSNTTLSWNATFTDYSAHLLPADSTYPLRHIVSSSTGDVLAIHDGSTLIWQSDVGHPVVAIYLLQNDGLHRLPFTVMGREAMESVVELSITNPSVWESVLSSSSDLSLFPALFLGESAFGIYAVNVYVDSKTYTVGPRKEGLDLLEGPAPIAADQPSLPVRRPVVRMPSGDLLVLGYHEPPRMHIAAFIPQKNTKVDIFPSIEYVSEKTIKTGAGERTGVDLIVELYGRHPIPFVLFVTTIIALCMSTVWLCGRQAGAQEARSNSLPNTGDVPIRHESVAGWVQVGKVFYDASHVLGTGCQGTVVFKGKFDGREVAVKRVLYEFLPLVDREAELLRESDTHRHVIRYFCMEADSQFRYLALELCVASLYDFVEKKELQEELDLSPMTVLKQAAEGLSHLHSINIVHRDLKPQNVLISRSDKKKARALISDFGLCKRIHNGRHSLSRRSGVAGTDGWIAPEALSCLSTSFPMDIFSLGCIFYYVLTDGKHPFGESLHRSSNILSGKYSLTHLKGEPLGMSLVDAMIQRVPVRRPSSSAVLVHPFFWGPKKQLQFFSDVSDRVEKEDEKSPLMKRLEEQGRTIVQGNWRNEICPALAEDLRKFRTYKGHSVRDLLRAMRNKKHHYRELPEDVRTSLGEIPHEFLQYFTSRFPKLLLHVYDAMEWCANETLFGGYYSSETKQRVMQLLEDALKRMAEDSSDCETWTRAQKTPQETRKKLQLAPRSTPEPPNDNTL